MRQVGTHQTFHSRTFAEACPVSFIVPSKQQVGVSSETRRRRLAKMDWPAKGDTVDGGIHDGGTSWDG